MSPNDAFLYGFSICFIIVMALMLAVPVLLRRSDVFTAWNFFLVGALVFNGLSGINAVTRPHYLTTYRTSDYNLYYLGIFVFYTTIILTYYFFPIPRKLAGRTFLRWPEISPTSVLPIVLALASFAVFHFYTPPIPGIAQFLFQSSLAAPTIAFTCAFVVWYRDRTNIFLLLLVIAVGCLALATSVAGGISRRYLISVLAAAPIALYWVWLRYKSTPVIVLTLVTTLFLASQVLSGYNAVRFVLQDEVSSPGQRLAKLVQELPKAITKGGSAEGYMGQDSVDVALMTIHLINDGAKTLEVDPLYSVFYVLSNPIPRSIWPDKPVSLGISLTRTSGLSQRGMRFNIGVNVIGQCYHDGGLWVHILYAFMFGAFLRYFDELLIRQPGNPVLIGGLVAMSGQILGWPRGGIETMTLQILMVLFLMVLVYVAGRIVLGAGTIYPRTDHLDPYPVLRSPADWKRWMGSMTAVAPAARRSYDREE